MTDSAHDQASAADETAHLVSEGPTAIDAVIDLGVKVRLRRDALDQLTDQWVAAIHTALQTHARDQVANAAGVSVSAMYGLLARRYGRRRPSPRRKPTPTIDV